MMASLSASLNLELTANELSAKEWSRFLSTFDLSTLDRSCILSLIKSLQSTAVDRAISTMKQIIQSRDKVPSDALAKVECIDQLSSGLIGEIGSYLNGRDYGRFEQCSRSLYVSCNSPNKVHEVTLGGISERDIDNCSSIDFCKYPSVRILDCGYVDISKLNMVSAMEHVTDLTLNCFTTAREFIDFLSKFPSLQRLDVLYVKLTTQNHDPNMINKLPPNVRKLGLAHHGNLMAEMLKFYASQIEELWCQYTPIYVQDYNLFFAELRCLNVYWREEGDHSAMQ